MPRVTLVTVAGGPVYERYASELMQSAAKFFKPSPSVRLQILNGIEGWPDGTLYRYHFLLRQFEFIRGEYVFLCDADMLFEAEMGPEILGNGITATLHPGYISAAREHLPYELRQKSGAYVEPWLGDHYYAGGFVGGRSERMLGMAREITTHIDHDRRNGVLAIWHDESHLNRYLANYPPAVTLTPAYCHPDNDEYYRRTVWDEMYPRILVALDKTKEERGDR